METKAKTSSFNLIILDESGSMSGLNEQTIAGCNETLNVIRSLQKKHGDVQRNLVSIYAFQSDSEIPSRYLVKNLEIEKVRNVTEKDYHPWGGTPLLDAVGSTLIDLEAIASTHEDAHATVTIITDGYENSSCEYSWQQVAAIINRLKNLGWTFNFIGANIDVDKVGHSLNIDNRMAFSASVRGTKEMWDNYNESKLRFEEERLREEREMGNVSREDRMAYRASKSKSFFNKK